MITLWTALDMRKWAVYPEQREGSWVAVQHALITGRSSAIPFAAPGGLRPHTKILRPEPQDCRARVQSR